MKAMQTWTSRRWKGVMAGACALGLMLSSAGAWATDVYLNGVKVNGMANQSFKDAKVSFDAQGNVRIEVEGVSIQRQDVGPQGQVAAVTPQVAQAYWLISSKSVPGMTQYDMDIHINGQFVVRTRSDDKDQLVMDISKYLMPGANKIQITAIKNLGAGRKSFSPEHTFGLVVGLGSKRGNALMIDKQLVSYQRTAADVANDTFEATLEAR